MPRIRLTLEYDGTRYHGWQKQTALPTIQKVLEDKTSQIAKNTIQVIGAGRTDAGVHAKGQVAHFDTQSKMSPAMWQRALNGILPPDVSVIKAEKVPGHFHSRYSALRKCYQYTILNRSFPSPFTRNHSWCLFYPLNVSKMRKGAALFKGKHDFNFFRSASCTAKHTIITLRRLDIAKKGDFIFLTFEARSFLMHMVRYLVGYLVTVGQEKITLKGLKGIINGSFQGHSQTAPPQGLCLIHVKYSK